MPLVMWINDIAVVWMLCLVLIFHATHYCLYKWTCTHPYPPCDWNSCACWITRVGDNFFLLLTEVEVQGWKRAIYIISVRTPRPTIPTYTQKEEKGKNTRRQKWIEHETLIKKQNKSSFRCVAVAEHHNEEQSSKASGQNPESISQWAIDLGILANTSSWYQVFENLLWKPPKMFLNVILESNVTSSITRSLDSFNAVPPILNGGDGAQVEHIQPGSHAIRCSMSLALNKGHTVR